MSRARAERGVRSDYRAGRSGPCLAWAGSAVVRYEVCAGGNNSVVECDLAKVEVAGSNPVSRSNFRSRLPHEREMRLADHK